MPLWRALGCVLAAAVIVSGTLLPAQALPPPAPAQKQPDPPPGLYTLHVYANLAQVPTLIVNPEGKPLRLTRNDFDVSLDGGQLFHPSQLRVEGDDPISLAIIIDGSGGQANFISDIAQLLAKLAPKDLHPRDHVSIYAVDCKSIQSVDDAPASADLIRDGVASALSASTLHGEKHKPPCWNSLHLWDIMAHAVEKLGETPSRRVVLVVSLGFDTGSATSFDQLTALAQQTGSAVFGLRDVDEYAFQRSFREHAADGLNGAATRTNVPDRLGRLAALSGGLIFNVKHFQIEDQLHRFIAMLRGRYIVEFPRPDTALPGSHLIAITVPSKWDYIIRYTGASMPLPDPSIASDPNTVPSSASPARFGNNRPKQPKH